MKRTLLTAVIAMMTIAASAQSKNDTLVISTQPEMHCQNCENRIKKNIRFVKGTKKIDASAANQKVTIIYDKSKATYQDYVAAFRKIGYEIKKK